jgi:hypothetical protein
MKFRIACAAGFFIVPIAVSLAADLRTSSPTALRSEGEIGASGETNR